MGRLLKVNRALAVLELTELRFGGTRGISSANADGGPRGNSAGVWGSLGAGAGSILDGVAGSATLQRLGPVEVTLDTAGALEAAIVASPTLVDITLCGHRRVKDTPAGVEAALKQNRDMWARTHNARAYLSPGGAGADDLQRLLPADVCSIVTAFLEPPGAERPWGSSPPSVWEKRRKW